MFDNVNFYPGNSPFPMVGHFNGLTMPLYSVGGFNNTNFFLPPQQFPMFPQQPSVPVTAGNQPYANQNFDDFCAKAYKGIPDRTTTVADKEKAILAKISILNHPQCPPEVKAELSSEITTINAELRTMDKTPVANENFDAFAERMYKGIPDRTNTVADKQKAILAKVAILNHPNCPPASKLELAKEIKLINNEIMQIKSNCNTKV